MPKLLDRRPVGFAFVLGCGRSGTTLLGAMIAAHPNVRYYFEPWSRWAAINPATDASGLIVETTSRSLVLDEGDASIRQTEVFHALFRAPRDRVLVEKTPRNALRIRYLDALAPDSRFIHIVRDGVEVSRSIEAIANRRLEYAGEHANPWWGSRDLKWEILRSEARERGYPAEWCRKDLEPVERAGLEWAFTVNEVERQADYLGNRLLTVRYGDLLSGPTKTLARVFEHIGLAPSQEALRGAADSIRSAKRPPQAIALPRPAAEIFNESQRRYQFANLAVPSEI